MTPGLAKACRWALYLLLLGLPLGLVLRPSGGGNLNLWAADLLLTVTTLGLGVWLFGKNRPALVPPLGIQVFALSLLACMLLNRDSSWVDALQWLVYTYGAWLLTSQAQAAKVRPNLVFLILIFHLLALSAVGSFQALSLQAPHYLIRGIFANYHLLSAFLVLGFLYVFPVLLIQRSRLYLSLAVLLSVGLFFCVKSPPAILAWTLGLLAQVILLAYFHVEWKNSRLVLSSLGGMLILAMGVLIQPTNLKDIAEYLHPYEPENVDLKFSRIQTILGLPRRTLDMGPMRVEFHDPMIHTLEVRPWQRYDDLDSQRLITQRLVERQVALNMAQRNPATGVGIGNYQEAKDFHFGSVVKVNTTEPFSYSSLATVLGTGGVVLLIGLLSFLSGQAYNVARGFREGKSKRALLIGAFGTSVAFLSLAYQMEVLIAPTLVLFTVLSTLGLRDFSAHLEEKLAGEA